MCLICNRISLINDGKNPYFVKELDTGYVVIGDHQHFRGYTIFLCKEHKTELFQLPKLYKMRFLEEMSIVAEAVSKAFKAEKMNYKSKTSIHKIEVGITDLPLSKVKELAAQYGMEEDAVRAAVSVDMLKNDIAMKKALAVITESAKEA